MWLGFGWIVGDAAKDRVRLEVVLEDKAIALLDAVVRV